MRICLFAAAMAALGLLSLPAGASNGVGLGVCKTGFADDTVVATQARGHVRIGELRAGDRVWSFNQGVGKKGWSTVVRRVDAGPLYRILADFSEPGSSEVTQACWIIRPAS